MVKCFFIGLLSLSSFLFFSCNRNAVKDDNAVRFETALRDAHLERPDTVRYLVWNTMSCSGCRSFSAQLMKGVRNADNIIFILPLNFLNEVTDLPAKNIFVDSNNIFGKLYFGIDNIGIVKAYRYEVQ